MEQVEGEAGAAGPERVAQGYGAAVHIGALAVEAELPLDGQVLRGERLVDLDQIQVVERQARGGKRPAGGGHRPDPHHARVHSCDAPREQPADRPEPALAGVLLAGHDQCGGAVTDPRCVAGGDDTVLFEIRRQLGQRLDGGARTHVLVGRPGHVLPRLPVLQHHRHHLVGERARLPACLGAGLAACGVAVHRLAPDVVPLGQPLRGLGHREAATGVAQRLPQGVLQRRGGSEPESPARATDHMRRLAHRLGAAGKHHT